MAVFTSTTGPVLNGSETGVRAQFVRLLISNDAVTDFASIEISVFAIDDNSVNTPKVPLARQAFTLNPSSVTNRTIPVSGFPIYEVQLSVTTPNPDIEVAVTTVGVDAGGKIVDNQQYLYTELTTIPALTP